MGMGSAMLPRLYLFSHLEKIKMDIILLMSIPVETILSSILLWTWVARVLRLKRNMREKSYGDILADTGVREKWMLSARSQGRL
jgi:hypothetical protein